MFEFVNGNGTLRKFQDVKLFTEALISDYWKEVNEPISGYVSASNAAKWRACSRATEAERVVRVFETNGVEPPEWLVRSMIPCADAFSG